LSQGLRHGRSRPPFQPPEPFSPIPKSVPNGSYAKGLFGFFEHLRMQNALALAEQSCRSGPRLEFGLQQRVSMNPGLAYVAGAWQVAGKTGDSGHHKLPDSRYAARRKNRCHDRPHRLRSGFPNTAIDRTVNCRWAIPTRSSSVEMGPTIRRHDRAPPRL
jgi:hypothetical protein